MVFVKLAIATNPHTNLVGVRRNRQCQGFGTHLHGLSEDPLDVLMIPLRKSQLKSYSSILSSSSSISPLLPSIILVRAVRCSARVISWRKSSDELVEG